MDAATLGAVAGGVEFYDLVAQTVPRRLSVSYKVSMNKIHFVPYVDSQCFTLEPELRQEINQYSQIVQSYSQSCLNRLLRSSALPTTQAELVKKGLEENNNNNNNRSPVKEKNEFGVDFDRFLSSGRCKLLQLIQQISSPTAVGKEFIQDVPTLLQSESTQIGLESDLLWSASFVNRSLKPLVDIALENTAGHFSRCAQIEPKSPKLAELCKSLQEWLPLIESEWILVNQTDAKTFDTDGKLENVVADINSDSPVPSVCQNLDLVVVDRVISTKPDIVKSLQNVKVSFGDFFCVYMLKILVDRIVFKRFMRDEGFLILNETTSLFDAAYLILGLSDFPTDSWVSKLPQTIGERIFNLFLSHDQWLQVFELCELQLIGYQTDSGLMTTLYLLRKIPEIPRKPTVVTMDDVNEFTWISQLRQVMEAQTTAPVEETVAVVSTEIRDNGTLGFALCLREECNKNRIR